MSSPSSLMKHRRLEKDEEENDGVFIPPLFHLPVRPPAQGFPSETDIIIPEASNNKKGITSNNNNNNTKNRLDGKKLLLNASPTLEFSSEEASSLLSAIRQHPKCTLVREQLAHINESFLEGIFGEDDAREDDTRRRVDHNAACAILKSNSSKRLSMCVSCLTRGQHRHYRAWMINYMLTGVVPKATAEYPDMSTVMDLVQREQTAYLHKFMEETIACEACKVEVGYNRRSLESNVGEKIDLAAAPPATHRSCWNHNYINEYVENFARRWWRYRVETRLQKYLLDATNQNNNNNNNNIALHEVMWDLKHSALNAGMKPVAVLTSHTRQLASLHVAETITQRELKGKSRILPSVSIPPTLPLPVEILETREPKLHIPLCNEKEEENKNEKNKIDNTPPPLLPAISVVGFSFSLQICKSALMELSTAHLSACRAGFRIPVRCVWHELEKKVEIYVEKPIPSERESRRNINTSVLKRLVDNEIRLPSNSRCSENLYQDKFSESKCYTDVTFDKDFAFQCISNCKYDIGGQHPVFRMIKMEYNCKGYNSIPDDEKTFNYESFSKKEIVRIWVLLHCNPTATLYIYRINAYSNAIIGIEQFSSISFMNQVMNSLSNDTEIQRTWNCLHDILHNLVTSTIQMHQKVIQNKNESSNTNNSNNNTVEDITFILSKEQGSSEISISTLSFIYPQLQLPSQESLDDFIEPNSRAVCRREYLPPCVWPFSERIPYTFNTTPKSCFVINRTTETRYDSEYYAQHDVWEKETYYYTVGEDNIIRERLPADTS